MPLDFRQATDRQLNDIAYIDDEAPLKYKLAALNEIKRRMERRLAITRRPAKGKKTRTYVP